MGNECRPLHRPFMITRPSTRPQSLLRAVVKQASALPRTQRRSKHTPPTWTDRQKQDRFAKNGVPGFLSANAYQETYAKYSQYLCDKLTEYTQGTPDESVQPRDLHFQCSHRPERAALYNHAAMANHTHFFWEALTDSEDPAQRRPGMQTNRFTGLLNAQPILCVNVWEHQWIPDYGVLGKRAYLTAWWDCIDWQVVENRLSTVEPDNYGYGGNRRTRNLGSIVAVGRGM